MACRVLVVGVLAACCSVGGWAQGLQPQGSQPQGSQPRVDYAGRPFVTQAAPVLRFEVRKAPRLLGIDYPFAEQTAQGVALFSRFPKFSLSDRRICVSGPWYADREANRHFDHGISAVEAMPNFRLDGARTSVRDLPSERKWQLMCDPLFWGHAARLADDLAKADPADKRIAALRTFAVDHKFTPDRDAFVELGRRTWREESGQTDSQRQGARYAMVDVELTGGWEHQRDCFGWIYEGMVTEAAKAGVKLIPVTYGQWTFEVGAVWTSMRQGGAGDPEYLLPEKDFLASPDPTLRMCEATGGVVSMDGYVQAIWGSDPFYKRGADGALLLDKGAPVFSDLAKTTVYGQEITLEREESRRCLDDLYRQATRMYLMYHRLAGGYPSSSEQRKDFLRHARIGAWTRITNEGVLDIQQNDRPLPSWLMETLTSMYLFLADDLVVWSSDTNTPPGALGGDYRKAWKYNAHGVVECIVKAAHRYSALDPIHAGPFKWCWFSLPMVNRNQTDGDRYEQKPLVFAKLRAYAGKPWIELWAAYPALDGESRDLEVWVEKAGKRSTMWKCRLANGRSTFYDGWQLPKGFERLEGADVHVRFRDLLGVTREWVGDWRRHAAKG